MRIEAKSQLIERTISSDTVNPNVSKQTIIENEIGQEERVIPKEKIQQAVDSINEIFEINHCELKFEFHEELEEYFVQLVDSETKEVVKEIPSKKLLDTFYEMQKLVGMIVDEKI